MMAAPLSRVHARVITPDATHEGVSIQIPPGRNTAIVRQRKDVLVTAAGVVSNEHMGGGHWVVTFEDGTVWDVTDVPKPCGCG